MNLLVVVTPPSIYHGCSTWKTFWKEKFTGKQDLLESVDTKNCGSRKTRKHKEIKGSDKCVTLNFYEILNISEKFDNMNKMETTSSESKVELERSGKGSVTALALKTKARSKKYRKRQGMPSEMSALRTFPIKSKGLKKMSRYLMWKGSPNINPLRVIFIYLCVLQSV